MSLWHRLACLSLLVASVLSLQSGAGWGGIRSATHRALPLARIASFLPEGGEPDTAELDRLRLELVARENEIRVLEERVGALTEFRTRPHLAWLEVVPAEIVFRRDPNPFRYTIYLDRGAVDGIELGDAAVWGPALVGQVCRVERSVCQVRLLTDPKMRVPAFVVEGVAGAEPGREMGVVVGRSEPTCALEFVPWTARLEAGMHLVSSGFGGEIPRGLVCGTVRSVANDGSAAFLDVEVEPAVDVDRLDQVLVVRREVIRAEPGDE